MRKRHLHTAQMTLLTTVLLMVAVPHSLAGSLITSSNWPWVVVYPPATSGGVATVFAPDGTQVSTTGTTTSGLQEAVNYANSHNFDLHIVGADEASSGSCTQGCGAVVYNINSGSTLSFPAFQGRTITAGTITINCDGSGSQPCVQFDSCMMCVVDLAASQIVAVDRCGTVLIFKPSNPVPLDRL